MSDSELKETVLSFQIFGKICSNFPTYVTDALFLLNTRNLFCRPVQSMRLFFFLRTCTVIEVERIKMLFETSSSLITVPFSATLKLAKVKNNFTCYKTTTEVAG
jgi:hypothetical protein